MSRCASAGIFGEEGQSGRPSLRSEDNESVLDCCTTRGLCNGILPEWEYTSADGVFYVFVRKCEGIKQAHMGFGRTKLPITSEKPIAADSPVFVGRSATIRAIMRSILGYVQKGGGFRCCAGLGWLAERES
ncbi:hypothetical protein D3C86_1863370 [compost metagenome]